MQVATLTLLVEFHRYTSFANQRISSRLMRLRCLVETPQKVTITKWAASLHFTVKTQSSADPEPSSLTHRTQTAAGDRQGAAAAARRWPPARNTAAA